VCVMSSGEGALLRHLVEHYRGLGVESFYLVRHAQATTDPGYESIADGVRELGLDLFHTHVGPFSVELHQALVRYAMYDNPEDWYIIADLDEMHVFDRPLPDVVDLCERGDFDHLDGCFVDRVAAGGGFPEVRPTPLWEQYPLACSISATLLRALPLKVVLARGHVELLTGQHGAPEGRGVPPELCYAQVHHFKWTGDVVARVKRRLALYSAGRWNANTGVVREAFRFLAHVERHGGRIDIGDPRFRAASCGFDYGDYPYWLDVVDEAQGWQWTLR
jgi:hypothetical protein